MTLHHSPGAGLLAAAAALFALSASTPARADTVTDWNAIATTAIITTAGQPPHASTPSLAMVQGAVYDAAAATAAFRVLAALFPGQLPTLQPLYDASVAAVPDGPAEAGGIAAGEAAAAAMLAARANDGRGGPFVFVFGSEPGDWRPSPPGFGLDPAPWVANVRPFLVPSLEMLRSDPPNPLTSDAYADDFNEVKRLGSIASTTRTADQTEAAIFWQDHGLALWNRVARALSDSQGLGIADNARLFAMTNLAAADGAIGCWHSKYHWRFWRPMMAIREAANDGNPATEADPAWTPLFDPGHAAVRLAARQPAVPRAPGRARLRQRRDRP